MNDNKSIEEEKMNRSLIKATFLDTTEIKFLLIQNRLF